MKFADLSFENKQALSHLSEKYSTIEETGHYLLGSNLIKFEELFAYDQESKFCVGVKNATDALAIVFRILGAPKKTIVVPQFGAYPTVIAAIQAGSKNIIAAPVNEKYCLDLKSVDVPRGSIIVPVNLFGNESNLSELNQIADSMDCVIVEDCAQSTGIPRQKLKTVKASIHSFYPTKPMGSRGDGGAILTDCEEIEQLARKARFYGLSNGSIDSWGFNSRMDEWQSAFLLEKIKYYRNMNETRRKNAFIFNSALGLDSTLTQTTGSVYHQYVTLWKNREKVQQRLLEAGVPTMVHYPKLISDMPYLVDKMKSFACRRVCDHILSLPVGPHLTSKDLENISNCLKALKNESIGFQDI